MAQRFDLPPASRWLRYSVAFVWLATGILVVHPLYRELGRAYLAPLGLGDGWMVAACVVEVVLAIMIISRPAEGWLAAIQIAAIAGFTLVLAWTQPMLLVHPYGVLTKNLPLVVAIWCAWRLQREGWSERTLRILRWGMAIIWITEGLFPKLLFQQPLELEFVRRLHLDFIEPRWILVAVGILQIGAGVGAIVGRGRCLAMILMAQLLALAVLTACVTVVDPHAWVHPFGPLSKNVPLFIGTLVVLCKTTPLLSADWSDILAITYRVPADLLRDDVPPGTQLDEDQHGAWISFVSLDFSRTCVFAIPCLGLRRFPDINFRFYVNQPQRPGVVFLRELVPSAIVAWVARTLYGEPFRAAKIVSRVERQQEQIHLRRELTIDSQRATITAWARPVVHSPAPSSREFFLLERYWGFRRGSGDRLRRFQVTHPAWQIYQVEDWQLDIDWAAIYGTKWSGLQAEEPASVAWAVGSPVGVWLPV